MRRAAEVNGTAMPETTSTTTSKMHVSVRSDTRTSAEEEEEGAEEEEDDEDEESATAGGRADAGVTAPATAATSATTSS